LCLFLLGGENGTRIEEIKDLFYYAQIRAQGENSMKKRKVFVVGTVRVS
jgi:uncharacterized NAD-dependent epimerase/dehydratase family protein